MKYSFTAEKCRLENGYIAWILKSNLLKGCVSQAYSLNDAIRILESNEQCWLQTAKELGITIPLELE